MLSTRLLLSRDGVEIADVACRHRAGRGMPGEQTAGHALVFVRRGSFVRSADGIEHTLDPTLAFCMCPSEEERYDHHNNHGDDCTALFLDEALVAALLGGEPRLPRRLIRVSPRLDLAHRRLLARARRGAEHHELTEAAIALAAGGLAGVERARVQSGRPATALAHRALADGVRAALAERPERTLLELSALLAVSPHHLSRVFRAQTGETIARHRLRLRVRAALERIAGGERDLARVAAETGFADQSHLCRAAKRETGYTPGTIEQLLMRHEGDW